MTRGSMPPFDLYEELEVSRQATPAVIEAAHRALVKRYHPDVASAADSPADNERITRLNIARDWLLDPVRRARYDRGPTARPAPRTVVERAAPRAGSRERQADAADAKRPARAARPARPSSAASFGANSREVRQFLAELRALDGPRTQRLVAARSAVNAEAYTAARDTSLAASREGRAEPWGFARDAAAVIVKNKAGDEPASAVAAAVAADIAGAIVVRDLMTTAQLERLREPWLRSASPVSTEPARRRRTAVLAAPAPAAASGAVLPALPTLPALASLSSLARQPRAVGLVAAGLAVVLAVALFAGGRKPDSAVAGLTSAPTGAALVPGGASPSAPSGSLLPGGSIDPFATSPAAETATPGSTAGATQLVPGRTAPPSGATFGPTPRATATPRPTPASTATSAPTSTPTPTGKPTPPPPTPSPPATCTVVSLVGTNTSNAQAAWSTAGFTGTVIFAPAPPPQYKIGWQSLAAGTDVACTSNITVQPTAP